MRRQRIAIQQNFPCLHFISDLPDRGDGVDPGVNCGLRNVFADKPRPWIVLLTFVCGLKSLLIQNVVLLYNRRKSSFVCGVPPQHFAKHRYLTHANRSFQPCTYNPNGQAFGISSKQNTRFACWQIPSCANTKECSWSIANAIKCFLQDNLPYCHR